MKKALIIRYGAYGDSIIITPVLRRLKELGYYVVVETSCRGVNVLANNTNIDELFEYEDDKVPNHFLADYWKQLEDHIKPDITINFCESIEVALAMHPNREEYKLLTKEQKMERCNKNYYEFTMDWAKLDVPKNIDPKEFYKPELFFTDGEEEWCRKIVKKNKFNVLFGLMGSGMNKLYPWNIHIINELAMKHDDINIITVGDPRCIDIEKSLQDNVIKLSGKIGIRESLALTKHVDLVVAPDTGLLHAAGCYDTPKIGLLGHTTKENITKHFINDHSIEAECHCAPCFNLVYEYKDQCPIDQKTKAAKCMGAGIPPESVLFSIKLIYNGFKRRN